VREVEIQVKTGTGIVSAAILDSESAKCRENAERRRRNVGIAVPHERALADVQFGVPAPDRK